MYECVTGTVITSCAGGKCNGKLALATRYNYAPDLGTVSVTDKYQYDGLGGFASRRDRAVGSSSSFDGQSFFFTHAYNDLGAVSSVTYPCRVVSGTCVTGERTPPVIAMTYSNGTLTGVGSWASNITYQPNGTIDTVTHGSGS